MATQAFSQQMDHETELFRVCEFLSHGGDSTANLQEVTDLINEGKMKGPIELLIDIRDITLMKLKEKLKLNNQLKHSLEKLDEKISDFVVLLSEIALIGIRNSNHLVPQSKIDKLKDKCMTYDLPPEEILEAFLKTNNSCSPDGQVHHFMFPHIDNQELYAAMHIYNQVFGMQTDDEFELNKDFDLLSLRGASSAEKVVPDLTNKSKAKGKTITDVLSEINREATNSAPMSNYKGTLTSFLGLLHHHKTLVTQESANELIGLLVVTGVTDLKHWITILNKTKCNPLVAKTIIRTLGNTLDIDLTVKDEDVFAYATLLEHKLTKDLFIEIKNNPSNISRLEELFMHLARDNVPINRLGIEYLFRHPRTDNYFMDSMNKVLRNCNIYDDYVGQMPSEEALLIRKGYLLTFLMASLASAKDAKSLFSYLQMKEETHKPLWQLGICIGNCLTADMLQKIPDGSVENIVIFIPDVVGAGDTRKGRRSVGDILKTLNTVDNRGIWQLFFPRYQGISSTPGDPEGRGLGNETEGGIRSLFQSLQGVKIIRGVFFPSRCRPTKDSKERELQEDCKRILQSIDGIIWGSESFHKGVICDMDSWE